MRWGCLWAAGTGSIAPRYAQARAEVAPAQPEASAPVFGAHRPRVTGVHEWGNQTRTNRTPTSPLR